METPFGLIGVKGRAAPGEAEERRAGIGSPPLRGCGDRLRVHRLTSLETIEETITPIEERANSRLVASLPSANGLNSPCVPNVPEDRDAEMKKESNDA